MTMITLLQLTTDFLFNSSASLVLFVAAILSAVTGLILYNRTKIDACPPTF